MEQGNGHGRAERFIKHSRAIRQDVQNLATDVSEVGRELRNKFDMSKAVQEHPFRSLAIAAGVGYVLGGGLFSRLSRRLLWIGGRAVVVPLVHNQLQNMLLGSQRVDS